MDKGFLSVIIMRDCSWNFRKKLKLIHNWWHCFGKQSDLCVHTIGQETLQHFITISLYANEQSWIMIWRVKSSLIHSIITITLCHFSVAQYLYVCGRKRLAVEHIVSTRTLLAVNWNWFILRCSDEGWQDGSWMVVFDMTQKGYPWPLTISHRKKSCDEFGMWKFGRQVSWSWRKINVAEEGADVSHVMLLTELTEEVAIRSITLGIAISRSWTLLLIS